jgi:cation diffusion facilitator CzcD-associated flavoprotein CzcO
MSFVRHLTRYMATSHLERQVKDPELRRRLTPAYEIGCKRILLSDTWYPAIQQPNVELVEAAVREITPTSIVGADGEARDVDTIIFGTGFRVTTHPGFDHIVGRNGINLGEVWREQGMEAYLGTTVAGFPNLFLMTGPNTGLGHSSIVFMFESQFAYVLGALKAMTDRGVTAFDVKHEAQAEFNVEIQARLAKSVWNSGGCSSWYLDARGRNPTLWPGSTLEFRRRLRTFDTTAYEALDKVVRPAEVSTVVEAALGD